MQANEIESGATYRHNVDKELSDNEEEEDAFSAVTRPTGEINNNNLNNNNNNKDYPNKQDKYANNNNNRRSFKQQQQMMRTSSGGSNSNLNNMGHGGRGGAAGGDYKNQNQRYNNQNQMQGMYSLGVHLKNLRDQFRSGLIN